MNALHPSGILHRLFDWTDPLLKQLFGSEIAPWQVLESLENRLNGLDFPVSSPDLLRERYPGAWFDPAGRYFIDPLAVIEPGAFLSGIVVMGPHSSAGHCARLRGPVYLAAHARVGHGSEIKHSLLLEKATAAHLNFVGDSILGEGVNLGAGAVCANLRFDRRPIVINAGELRLQTSMKKCGAFIGAGSQVGCSATVGPGSVLARNVWVGPNCSVRGWLAEGARPLKADGGAHGVQ